MGGSAPQSPDRNGEHAPKYASAFAASGWVTSAILLAIRRMPASRHLCISRDANAAEAIRTVSLELKAHRAFPRSGSLRRAPDRSNSTLTTVAAPFKKRGLIHGDIKRAVITI